MRSVIGKWIRLGSKVAGESGPLSEGLSLQASQAMSTWLADLGESATNCLKSESMGIPSGDAGQIVMMSLSTLGCSPEGQGPPGALARALESPGIGGVDFSTLEMRYIFDDPDSGGLQFSFSGRPALSGRRQNADSALNAFTDSGSDLRTWLVLSPDQDWVNLNPIEPYRIIDPQLGETGAGEALLEADLRLKRTSAKLEDPRTTIGARYWKALAGSSRQACYGSRMWIVPGNVQVYEHGGSLYILQAKLAVKSVPEHVVGEPSSCHYDPATDARGKRLDDTMLVPRITKEINTAPQYSPIRRAFMARIAAQWIRDRYYNGQRTSFDQLIDSGKIGPARLQNGWRPQQVFDSYVHLIKHGIFTDKTTVHRGSATYVEITTVGGVDFTRLHLTSVSGTQMEAVLMSGSR